MSTHKVSYEVTCVMGSLWQSAVWTEDILMDALLTQVTLLH